MQTNPAAEQSKIIRWHESPWNPSGRKGKGLACYCLRMVHVLALVQWFWLMTEKP